MKRRFIQFISQYGGKKRPYSKNKDKKHLDSITIDFNKWSTKSVDPVLRKYLKAHTNKHIIRKWLKQLEIKFAENKPQSK